MSAHVVAAESEVPRGSTRIVEIDGRNIGIIRTSDGRIYALRNVCPHHGAPLCAGQVTGRMSVSQPHEYAYDLEETLVRCPWHGYSFNLEDGRSDVRPETFRTRSYRVAIEDGNVVVHA